MIFAICDDNRDATAYIADALKQRFYGYSFG